MTPVRETNERGSADPVAVGEARSGVTSASQDLSDSLYSAVLGAVAGWQVLVIVGVVTSPATKPSWLLVSVHLAIAVAAAVGRRSRPWGVVAWAGTLAGAALDLSACVGIDDPYTFTTIWTMNLFILGPVLVLRGWPGVVAGLLSVVYATTVSRVLQPEFEVVHEAMITTGTTMVVAGALLTRYIHRFAASADAEIDRATTTQVALTAATSAGRRATHLARTMHDTAVNTLSAISRGGAATSDLDLVRERCARDVETLQAVLGGAAVVDEPHDLAAIGDQITGITVRRTGPTPDGAMRVNAEVPRDVREALRGAADEAVRNAARHSGADAVEVRVHFDDVLRIDVVDRGTGFDPTAGLGQGLAESVHGRAADVGAEVEIETRGDGGTCIRLLWRPASPDLDRPGTNAPDRSLAEQVRRWACWAWAIGVVAVGFPIEYAPRPGIFTWTYVALALVGLAAAWSWWLARRHEGSLPGWAAWVLVGLIQVAFVLSYAGVADVPHLWQAISVTPLPVILLVHRRMTQLWVSLVLLVFTIAVLAVVVSDGELSRAGIVVVGAAPQIGLVLGWAVFHRVVGVVADASDLARRRTAASRSLLATRRATDAVHDRWRQAEARQAVEVLAAVASGEVDPQDQVVRQRCSTVERALRQIMQLSPEAIYLGPWVATTMSRARDRGVQLDVRTGDVDASDPVQAQILGDIMAATVDAVDAGGALTIGVFGDEESGRLLLVASRPIPVPPVPSGWVTTAQDLGSQRLVEVVWPRSVTVVT